jgi:hypothetical protein
MAPATSPATPAIKTSCCVAAAAATPTIRLAVETMPSLAPSTAALNHPMRATRWFSGSWQRRLVLHPVSQILPSSIRIVFVGGRFSSNIWVLDRTGTIIETIDILADYPHAVSGRVRVTDLELAPSSDPNDDPGKLNLYVADYGADNVNDGRLFEIDLGNSLWPKGGSANVVRCSFASRTG